MEAPLFYDKVLGQQWVAVKDDNGYSIKKTKISIPSSVSEPPQLENLTIIDSVKSGTGRDGKASIYHHIIKPTLDHLKVPHNYVVTTSGDTIGAFSRQLTQGTHKIVLISGDTSVNELINSLSSDQHGQIRLVVIPLGTGNSLSLALGISNELEAVKRLVTSNEFKPLNLYTIKFPEDPSYVLHEGTQVRPAPSEMKFLVVFSWGFHASLVADSDTAEMRKFGLERFKMAAMSNLEAPQHYEGTTKISSDKDTREVAGPYAYWVLTPSRRFEPTFEISPSGNIFNDEMYLVSFGPRDTDQTPYIMEIMTQAYNGGAHIHNGSVSYEQVDSTHQVRLKYHQDQENRRRFCVDGAVILAPPSGEFRVRACGHKQQKWEIFVLG